MLQAYGVPYVTEGQHTTDGWVNVHCPFCAGSRNYHLGISPTGGCHCWRCGGHSLQETVSKLLNVTEQQARSILRQYKTRAARPAAIQEPRVVTHTTKLKYPTPNRELTPSGRRYLEARHFNPAHLVEEWRIKETGPVSYLNKIDYSFRILIPIYWEGKPVTFQARDITGKSKMKYLACPKDQELVHHKNIVYAHPDGVQGRVGIVVEGVTDVWRLGRHAVATLGIEYKMEQVLTLAALFDRLYIVFDREPQAQKQAKSLAVRLRALGREAIIEQVQAADPGDMGQEEADYFVHQLLEKGR
jgi:hypothetical protein